MEPQKSELKKRQRHQSTAGSKHRTARDGWCWIHEFSFLGFHDFAKSWRNVSDANPQTSELAFGVRRFIAAFLVSVVSFRLKVVGDISPRRQRKRE